MVLSLRCSPWRMNGSLPLSQIFMEARERREIAISEKKTFKNFKLKTFLSSSKPGQKYPTQVDEYENQFGIS
jgi:hypothetical protein